MVVDDEEDIVELMLIFLQEYGHNADGVTTIEDALEKLFQNHYDCVILDVNLHGRSCEIIIKELERNNSPNLEKIVLFSGYIDPSMQYADTECFQRFPYIQKGIAPTELIKKIEEIFNS